MKDKILLGVRLSVFPLATLIPYFLLRIRDACPPVRDLRDQATCFGQYIYPSNTANLVVLGLMTLLVLISVIRFMTVQGSKSDTYAWKLAKAVILTLVLTTIAFFVMRYFSQSAGSGTVGMGGGVVGPDGRTVVETYSPLFGVGISVATYVYASMLFVAGWLLEIYRYKFSRKWIGGIKKKDLFQ